MSRAARLAWFVGLLVCAACAADGESERVAPVSKESSSVCARVNGVAVTVGDVEYGLRQGAASAEESLRRMIETELLLQEATRRGITRTGVSGASERGVDPVAQAAVHGFLQQEVEGAVHEGTIDDEALEALYAEQRSRFVRPERRASHHILARVAATDADGPQRAFIESIAAAIAQSDDPVAQMRAASEQAPAGLDIKVEAVPLMARDAKADEAYKERLFALRVGEVSRPVRTAYGWHVLVLKEIAPAVSRSFQEVRPELLDQAIQRGRAQRLQSLLEELRMRYQPQLDDARARAVLEDPSLYPWLAP